MTPDKVNRLHKLIFRLEREADDLASRLYLDNMLVILESSEKTVSFSRFLERAEEMSCSDIERIAPLINKKLKA